MRTPRPHALLAATLAAVPAWAASPMSRLQGVSQHAREQANTGPDHLWVGLGIGVALAAAIAAAALWTLNRRRG